LLQTSGHEIRDHLVTDVVALSDAARLMLDIARPERHVMSALFTVDCPPGGCASPRGSGVGTGRRTGASSAS